MTNKDELVIGEDEAFDEAMKVSKDFLLRHKDLGPLALITLARAVGLLTVLTSQGGGREKAIGEIVNQMTSTMLDAIELEEDAAQ